MKFSLPLVRLSFLALMLWTQAVFADAICSAGPTCPGFFPATLGPLPAVEGVQGVLPMGVFVTAGDVLLMDVGGPLCSAAAPTFCSDVLRFFDIGNGTAHFYLLFSDDPGTEPPDTGIPLPIQANNFKMDEVGGPLYTAGGASYLIMSDTTQGADVPEPSTLFFQLTALMVRVGIARHRFKKVINKRFDQLAWSL